MLHSGPTSKASLAFRRDIQYWTSRGFAVMDLNYRGSSGFGRDYRRSIYGRWGQADVEDAVRAAGYLVNKGWVDGTKLAIRGNSAGGLTVLSALAFYNTFKAGVSYSGISDIEVLKQDLHKFESHYVTQLIGKDSESKRRSPMNNLSGLTEPLLLIQGGKIQLYRISSRNSFIPHLKTVVSLLPTYFSMERIIPSEILKIGLLRWRLSSLFMVVCSGLLQQMISLS